MNSQAQKFLSSKMARDDPAGVMQDVANILLEAVTIKESDGSQLGFLHEVGEMARDADRS